MKFKIAAAACALTLAACGGSAITPPHPSQPLTPTHRALLVGAATGPVYGALTGQYQVTPGTGNEDPTGYDMVIFDGNSTSAQSINANAAVANFLSHGKAVVLLNNTETLRNNGLKGILFAHAQGTSPGSIFYIARDQSGRPQREVEIEFPVHAATGGASQALASPSPAQLTNDSLRWMGEFQHRFASGGSNGNIDPAVSGAGQTVFSFDVVQPVSVSMGSELNTAKPGGDLEFCGNVTSPNGWGSCNPTTNPTITTPDVGVDYETLINVLLEPNGQSFQDKIIARQYALFSAYPWPNQQWVYGYYMADAVNGTNNANIPLTTMLGFNEAVSLTDGPAWNSTYPMTVVEAVPTANNNTSQLTTSYSHTEAVGLSVSGGYQGGGVGLLGANWSDSWTWGSANTISISDWTNDLTQQNGLLTYQFWASGNTPNTFYAMQDAALNGNPSQYDLPQDQNLKIGANYLNALQSSSMVSQDESEWLSQGPIGPYQETFQTNASFTSGEVFQFLPSIFLNAYNYGYLATYQLNLPIVIDFSNPSLQPPSQAPWTLSFGNYKQSRGSDYAQTDGTITLNQPAATDTTVNVSYVIQPQQQMITLPANEACQGNTTQFNPGNSVINNGNPPLSIKIPAGQKSATFPLSFQTFNSDTYNVQVVAWLPNTNLGGTQVTNPQSAWCLTPPNTLP